MTKVTRPNTAFTKSIGTGAVLGLLVGAAGAASSASEAGNRLTPQPLLTSMGFCLVVGAISGAIFWRLGWMRRRGPVAYLGSWMISVGPGMLTAGLAVTMPNVTFVGFLLLAAMGAAAGLGIGLVAYEVRRRLNE